LDGEDRQAITRNPKAEQALRQRLQQLGLRPALRQSLALPKDSAEMYDLSGEAAWLHFVQQQLPQLRDEGWEIVIQPGFAYDLTDIEHWYAEVEESPEHSWFELVLGIVVEGQRISLLPVLLDVIRKTPMLLAPEQLAQR